MASNFTLEPDIVIPSEPELYTIKSPFQGGKSQRLDIADEFTRRWKLVFKALTNDQLATLLSHVEEAKVDAGSFSWTTVPDYIDTGGGGSPDGGNMTGYWVKGTLNISKPSADNVWPVSIEFEQEVA